MHRGFAAELEFDLMQIKPYMMAAQVIVSKQFYSHNLNLYLVYISIQYSVHRGWRPEMHLSVKIV